MINEKKFNLSIKKISNPIFLVNKFSKDKSLLRLKYLFKYSSIFDVIDIPK